MKETTPNLALIMASRPYGVDSQELAESANISKQNARGHFARLLKRGLLRRETFVATADMTDDRTRIGHNMVVYYLEE